MDLKEIQIMHTAGIISVILNCNLAQARQIAIQYIDNQVVAS